MQYRHEWKTEITALDRELLRARLDAVLQRDPHTGPDGCYFIRSLYFDNREDTALREKLDGVNIRDKFRIRYYNLDTSRITLELKHKENSLGYKLSERLSIGQTESILRGDTDWLCASEKPLLRRLGESMLHGGYRPACIVDYMREPFIYPAGNVRVTLDYDIRTGLRSTGFLDPGCVTVPVGPVCLLEVKYDNYLPDLVRDIVQLGWRRSAAFSKYAACRMLD